MEPFFQDTVQWNRQAPRCRTPLESLREVSATNILRPAAFVFHASRCGSTLMMQMLARVPGCRCISEPAALDELLAEVLLMPDPDDAVTLLRGLIRAFGQEQKGMRHLFLKHDSWHVAALPLMQRAFPETPCWFLHRDPAAILRSHRQERGSQMVPGLRNLAPFGIRVSEVPVHDLETYAITVLTGIFSAASKHIAAGSLTALGYNELPEALNEHWLARHGIEATPGDVENMKRRAAFHAKRPVEPWTTAAESSREEGDAGIVELQRLWRSLGN